MQKENNGSVHIPFSVITAACELFEGDRQAAIEWLKTPAVALGGKRPLDVLSKGGENVVLRLIGRLERGVTV